ncbi:MAG: glycerol acyltransferase, partial [Mucinivorans sp.]
MILAAAIEPIRPGVKLIVNDVLMNIEPLRPIFVGVNKYGGQPMDLSRVMDNLYHSESPIINFPAGLCSRLGRDGIKDLNWHMNFIHRSIETQRMVIPTFVKARNSMFFYRLARLRSALGIKANIELILLPRQVFFQKGKTVEIFFGKPITLHNRNIRQVWCDRIRERVYGLNNQNDK